MIIGYWHAKRRINKGLRPLAYHRVRLPQHRTRLEANITQWLLNRQQRARYDPSYQNPHVFYTSYPQPGGQYGMNPMPPQLYDPNGQPPNYQPPAGASKVDPSQWRSEPIRRPAESGEQAPEYEAPPGPPPAPVVHASHTGGSTVSNNPYRL
jgi:hypothetical protein